MKKTFRVLTYNLHKGFDSLGRKFVLEMIRLALRETKADLLLLQEVVGLHPQSRDLFDGDTQFEYLADQNWTHYAYGKNAVYTDRHHGNAILCQYPIVEWENLNISTNRFEERGLLHATIELPSELPEDQKQHLHVFNVHLDLLQRGRAKQLIKMMERAQGRVGPNDLFIVGGDFNDWAKEVGPALRKEMKMKECHLELHGTYAKSFPSALPFLSLDRLYYRGLKLKKAEVLTGSPWNKLSDHLPLVAEFEMDLKT